MPSMMHWMSFSYMSSRAYRPRRGREHVTAVLSCVPSKIMIRQWFVTNYSNSCHLDSTMHIEDFYYFQLTYEFARCLLTCLLL